MPTPEATYTQWYHRKLKAEGVYCLKLNLMYANGVADSWFSGNLDDCWIEFKYIKELPKRSGTLVDFKLSELQKHWIAGRCNQGRDVYLIVGSPHHHYMVHGTKIRNVSTEEFINNSTSREQLCTKILNTIHG